jgi:uncharacterized membrane protein YiaA
LLGAAGALFALTCREPERGAQDPDVAAPHFANAAMAWSELRRNGVFLFTTFGMALMTFALVGLSVWTPTLLVKTCGLSLDESGLYLGVLAGVTGIGGAALGGWLGDRLSNRPSGDLLRLASAATMLAVPLVAVAVWSASLAVVLGGLGLGLTLVCLNVAPLDTVLIAVTSPNLRGSAFAGNLLVIHLLGEMPAPIVIGAVSDATGALSWGLLLSAVALLLSSALFWAAARPIWSNFANRSGVPQA